MQNQTLNKFIFCIVGPSGSGKSSLIKYLLQTYPELFQKFLTVTDRPMREYEKQDEPYRFVSALEFDEMIQKNDLLEYELQEHNNCRYGKTRSFLNNLQENKIILTELQIYKVEEFKKALPDYHIYSCFMNVENISDMEKRLLDRGDDIEKVKNRLKLMVEEGHKNIEKADFVIPSVSGEIQISGDKIMQILKEDLKIL